MGCGSSPKNVWWLRYYRGEIIFGIVADNTPYFKVSDINRPDYEAAGSEPFTYESRGKRATMSYWLVPAEILDDQEMLSIWAEKA